MRNSLKTMADQSPSRLRSEIRGCNGLGAYIGMSQSSNKLDLTQLPQGRVEIVEDIRHFFDGNFPRGLRGAVLSGPVDAK
jgi:hypothetical protein